MNLHELEHIDWQVCLTRANNNPEFAVQTLSMLMNELPEFKSKIGACWQQKNYSELYMHVHKLCGALCYVGLPKLRELATELEIAAKHSSAKKIDRIMKQLNPTIDAALQEFSTLDLASLK